VLPPRPRPAVPGKTRIILADDHPILRSGVKSLINEEPNLTVVAEAGNGEELLTLLSSVPCDLLILDLSMPGMSGLKALETIRKSNPGQKILVLSMHSEPEFVHQALAKKVQGYLLKDEVFGKLISAIKSIAAGHKSFSDKLISVVTDERTVIRESHISLELLTGREREVLVLLARGMNNQAIGAELDISPRTVEAYRGRIMDKLGFANISELVRYAADKGLV
jgi:DNA-binding NarL/FixJ family response regulator